MERRRPVTPGEAGVPAGAFEERTIQVHQTTEEPVVSKTAHVAEEVVVHKESTERTETVRDDVRREEVEIQNPLARVPSAVFDVSQISYSVCRNMNLVQEFLAARNYKQGKS